MKTNLDIEEAYSSVQKLLYDLAWQYSKRYGIEFEDCRSEVEYGFMKAYRRWTGQPTVTGRPFRSRHRTYGRGQGAAKFSSLCYMIGQFRLRRMVMDRVNAAPTMELNEEICETEAGPAQVTLQTLFDDTAMDLSEDARNILQMLVETPQEILEETIVTPRQLMKRVKEAMIEKIQEEADSKSKSRARVREACQEIQERLQEAWAV